LPPTILSLGASTSHPKVGLERRERRQLERKAEERGRARRIEIDLY
jgi:hypothetical protein